MSIDPRRFRGLALATVVAAGVAFAGCGQKDEPDTDGPVVPITTTTTSTTGGQDGGPSQGGSDGSGGQPGKKPVSDEKAVQDAIEKFLTSPNADFVCQDLLTPQFLRRAYGNVAGCTRARKPATLAVSAQISGLRVQGSKAEANAKPNGGINNDERLTFRLERSGANWLISTVRSNVRVGP